MFPDLLDQADCLLSDADDSAGQTSTGIARLCTLFIASFAQVIGLLMDLWKIVEK